MLVQYHWQQARSGRDGFLLMNEIPYVVCFVAYIYWSQMILYQVRGKEGQKLPLEKQEEIDA